MPLLLTKTVKLHRAQYDFCHSPALFRGFVAGRGSGKTYCGAYDAIRRGQRGRTYLVGSPTYTLMQDITLPTFKAIAEDLGVWGEFKATPRPNVRLTTGATYRFRSAEEPDKMRGPNLSGVWLDEASLMHRDAYRIAIACLREEGTQGWFSSTMTPKGLTHWTYDVFGRNQPDTAIFHARTADNPFNPPEFAETLARQYLGQFAQQELEGRFVALEGAEWPAEYFHDGIWFDRWPTNEQLRILSLDPSKGKDAKVADPGAPKGGREGDYSAYVEIRYTGDGTCWVDADLNNFRDAQRIVDDGVAHLRRLKPHAFVIETNTFQELFAPLFKHATEATQTPFPGYGANNRTPKVVRIRTLGPTLAGLDGRFRFKAGSVGAKMLVEQLRDFPVGEFDDAPDALQMGVTMLRFLLSGQRGADTPVILKV